LIDRCPGKVCRERSLFQSVKRSLDGLPEGSDVAELMAAQEH
jgi:hypothetical protein